MASIHIFGDKIKALKGENGRGLLLPLLLAMVAGISFYLGYIAHIESAHASPVVIQCPSQAYIQDSVPKEAPLGQAISAPNGAYIASRNGSKYYPVDCSGASRIKEENKIVFETAAAAEAAGYSLALGCQ